MHVVMAIEHCLETCHSNLSRLKWCRFNIADKLEIKFAISETKGQTIVFFRVSSYRICDGGKREN